MFLNDLINYAADKLGLDRELFVPIFHTMEGVLTKNPASILLGVGGIASKAIASFGKLARVEDPVTAAKEVGINLPTLKHAAVSFVADWFTKRFSHMGDVLRNRKDRHRALVLKTPLQKAAKAGRVNTALSRKAVRAAKPQMKQ